MEQQCAAGAAAGKDSPARAGFGAKSSRAAILHSSYSALELFCTRAILHSSYSALELFCTRAILGSDV
jgi:hypothetical protein